MVKRALCVLMVLMLCVGVTYAGSAPESAIAKLDFYLTPEDMLAVSMEDYSQLSDSEQNLISELLGYIASNFSLFTLNKGKLEVAEEAEVPSHLVTAFRIIQGKPLIDLKADKTSNRAKRRMAVSVMTTPPYPGAYSWYTETVADQRQGAYQGIKTVAEARCQPCANEPVKLTWEIGNVSSVGTQYTIAHGLNEGHLTSQFAIILTDTVTYAATSTIEYLVQPGYRATIGLYHWVNTYDVWYDQLYFEDWDYDGRYDYCYYLGRKHCGARIPSKDGMYDRIGPWYVGHTFPPTPCPKCFATP